jgi:autotransporter family porin
MDRHAAGEQVRVDSRVDSVMMGIGHALAETAGGQLQVGLMAGHGRATNDATSRVTGYTARGVVSGTSLGLYGTWVQEAGMLPGAYVDSWLQYARFRNRVQGQGLAEQRYRSRNWSGSVEGGYTLPLHSNGQRGVYLEPQLQVIHNHYNADEVVEATGTVVESRRAGGTSTRLGARLYTRALTQKQGQVHPFVAVNWWSGGNASAIAVDGEAIRRDLPDDLYEAKAGVQVNLSGGWRGWGQISHQTGSQGYRDTSAQLGVSLNW